MKIINVVGARPNFIKIAPLISEMKKYPDLIEPILLHTGQHYDKKMSEVFFKGLNIPKPDVNLSVGSGSQAWQTAEIMKRLEKILEKERPDLVLVVGDVNSTLAGALVTSKLGIPVAHVEAGLRSFNWQMPEEINRVVTDRLSDYLFTSEPSANKNLIKEGIDKNKIFFVGNVMIDTLKKYQKKASQSSILEELNLKKRNYAVLTLHRPEIVDKREKLVKAFKAIANLQNLIKIVYPIHPRTEKMIAKFRFDKEFKNLDNLILTKPLNYLDFLHLISNSEFVLTDSGGIQEETTVLRIPCLTLRDETERPITVIRGTNTIVGLDEEKIFKEVKNILKGKIKKSRIPQKWDGQSSKRIIKILIKNFRKKHEII